MDQAESLRNIIKKQEIDEKKRTARVITVTSGKGGVGKTSFSVNLAIQLHRLGKRVVVLDADFGLANIEIMLGIRPKYNLADLMFRGKSIQDVMTYGPEGIGFLSGGSGINHVAMYIGDGKIVHASTYATGIKISKWNYRNPVKIVSMF